MRSWFQLVIAALAVLSVVGGCKGEEEQNTDLSEPISAPIGTPGPVDPKNPPKAQPPRPEVPGPGERVTTG